MMQKLKEEITAAANRELNRANEQFPLFTSKHEGVAVAYEELEESKEALEELEASFNGNIEKGKKIIVRMPQKGVFEAIKDVEANGTGEDADTSTIYNLVAAVLNNNMGNVKVSAEEVESYDIEECTAILNAYMEFVDELKANPN